MLHAFVWSVVLSLFFMSCTPAKKKQHQTRAKTIRYICSALTYSSHGNNCNGMSVFVEHNARCLTVLHALYIIPVIVLTSHVLI